MERAAWVHKQKQRIPATLQYTGDGSCFVFVVYYLEMPSKSFIAPAFMKEDTVQAMLFFTQSQQESQSYAF